MLDPVQIKGFMRHWFLFFCCESQVLCSYVCRKQLHPRIKWLPAKEIQSFLCWNKLDLVKKKTNSLLFNGLGYVAQAFSDEGMIWRNHDSELFLCSTFSPCYLMALGLHCVSDWFLWMKVSKLDEKRKRLMKIDEYFRVKDISISRSFHDHYQHHYSTYCYIHNTELDCFYIRSQLLRFQVIPISKPDAGLPSLFLEKVRRQDCDKQAGKNNFLFEKKRSCVWKGTLSRISLPKHIRQWVQIPQNAYNSCLGQYNFNVKKLASLATCP